jgi:hypothetical protein
MDANFLGDVAEPRRTFTQLSGRDGTGLLDRRAGPWLLASAWCGCQGEEKRDAAEQQTLEELRSGFMIALLQSA